MAQYRWKSLIRMITALTIFGQHTTLQHPQCLDFKAPFNSSHETFEMCQTYKDFGCCDSNAESKIIAKFEQLKDLQPDQNHTICDNFLSTLLCQPCSPYSAHIYDAENLNTETRSFPSLCGVYCKALLKACKPTVEILVNGTERLSNLLKKNKTAEFCKAVEAPDKDYCFPSVTANEILNEKIGTVQFYKGKGGCQTLCVKEVANDLYNPLTMKHANDGSHRVFVGEQRGVVWVYLPDFTRLETPFLDIRESVLANERSYDERGFLDIEFHPNFANNGRFFICYTHTKPIGIGFYVTVNEMRVSTSNMNVANISSEKVILKMEHMLSNHNGGQLLFSDEGYLLISTGDGGGQGDILQNGQRRNTLLGKILRINVDNIPEEMAYTIPDDNPFVSDSSYAPEIYALGFRNLWRCSKDRGNDRGFQKGRIFCGDVGQSKFEEIDIIKKGGNYGWNVFEGNNCYKKNLCKQGLVNYIKPIHAYPHTVGKSVTGGYVYRGCENPNLYGAYIFGDYHNGKVFALRKFKSGKWSRKELCLGGPEVCKNDGLSPTYSRKILAFGEDESGELYILSTQKAVPGFTGGSVYKIIDPSKRGSPGQCRRNITRETIINVPENNMAHIDVGIAQFVQNSPKHSGTVMATDGTDMGLLCADARWDIRDANVVCKSLGFHSAISAGRTYLLPMRIAGRFLGNINCSGEESNLSECRGISWQTGCFLYGDATVKCRKKAST